MIISKSKKFIFLHIPKTAGSNLRKVLVDYGDVVPEDLLPVYNRNKGHVWHIKQPYLKTLLAPIDLSDYLEFAVVREPLGRWISLYNHSSRRMQWDGFSKFAMFMASAYRSKKNNHFYHSQCEWICNPLTGNIRTYRFEDVTGNPADFFTELGINETQLGMADSKDNRLTINDLTDKEIYFSLDVLSEEYETLQYQMIY